MCICTCSIYVMHKVRIWAIDGLACPNCGFRQQSMEWLCNPWTLQRSEQSVDRYCNPWVSKISTFCVAVMMASSTHPLGVARMCLCSSVSWMSPTSIHLSLCDHRFFWVFVRSTTADALAMWQLVQVCPEWHWVEQKRLYFLQVHAVLALQWFQHLQSLAVSLHYPSPPLLVSVLHRVLLCVHDLHCFFHLFLFLWLITFLCIDGGELREIGNLLTNRVKHLSSKLGKSCSGLLYHVLPYLLMILCYISL